MQQEYAQAFHGEKIDRIMEPKAVDNLSFGCGKVQSFKTAGSSSLLLDGECTVIQLVLTTSCTHLSVLMKSAGAI